MTRSVEPDSDDGWIASRPQCVQALVAEFPRGTSFREPDGTILWVIGYTETDEVILTRANPYHDYDRALAGCFLVPVSDLRRSIRAASH